MSFFKHSLYLLFIKFFFSITYLYATTYYVSNSGDDLNSGTSSSTPWKSIDKVNSIMTSLNPGDQILFNKGNNFYGTINASKSGILGNEIVFGSYGSGNLPVITGKKIINSWTVYSGNIYKASLNIGDTISNIYCNGKIMTIARFPNSGFLRTDVSNGNNGFYDAALNQSSGFWNGADCKIRTKNWTYEIKTVANYSGGSILFTSPTVYTNFSDFGYYFDNKLNLLDVQNEFYFDKATATLYFYAPAGVNPNSLNVEAVVLKNGINMTGSRNFIFINNIHFNGFSVSGINCPGNNNNISVQYSKFSHISLYGTNINGQNGLVANNIYEDNLNNAITGVMINSIVRYNTIKRTALIAGYGKSGSGYTSILANNFNGSLIEFNTIDSSGYNGIGIAKTNVVRNNVIDYSCLVLNDGGGIDITHCDNLIIQNNIISNTKGNYLSSGIAESYGCGIYVNGAIMTNTSILGNTVFNNGFYGILVDHKNTPNNNKIIGNTCYNNAAGQLLFTDFSASVYIPSYNTIVKHNILYSLSADQSTLHLRGHTPSGISDFGNFDSNYYCNPYSEFLVTRTTFYPVYDSRVNTLEYWQNTFNKDPNSKSLPFSFDQYGITDTLSENLIQNSTFDTTYNPWISWPSGASLLWNNNPILQSGSMKVRWNGIGYTIGFALSNRYSITSGNHYLVSLSSAGNHSGTFSIWGFSSLSSTTFSFPQTFFSYDTEKRDYSLTYKANITDPQAYMSVGLILPDSVVYVDNLKMYRVNVEKIDSTELSKFFVNNSNAPSSISLNGIPYKDIEGNSVSGSISLEPYTSKILVNEGFIPSRKLFLKILPEGFYNTVTDKMIPDTVTVLIRNATAPFNVIDSIESIIDENGNGIFDSFNAFNSTYYYLTVKHRNSIETWSKSPVYYNGNILNYDFTTSANQAYGNNLKNVGTKFCIYSGDVNNDGEIELSDILEVFNSARDFGVGYLQQDVNGDGVIDLSDIGIVFNNTLLFVNLISP